MLADAYCRRKQWEAKLLAAAVVNMLGEAMGGETGDSGQPPRTGQQRGDRPQLVSPDAFIRETMRP